MSKVNVSHVYNATADQVWSLIGDPGGLASWHPAIASSPADKGRRTCTLADGGEVTEEITAHDDSARSYTYRIVSSPLPMSGYVSTLRVAPADGGRAKVIWEGEFEPEGIEPAELEEMIRGLYTAGLDALESKIG